MRKRIIQQIQPDVSLPGEGDWLKVEDLAEVEVTSEDTAHPIECALLPNHETGGVPQNRKSRPSALSSSVHNRCGRIHLNFLVSAAERTQEYVLRCSPNGGRSSRR